MYLYTWNTLIIYVYEDLLSFPNQVFLYYKHALAMYYSTTHITKYENLSYSVVNHTKNNSLYRVIVALSDVTLSSSLKTIQR